MTSFEPIAMAGGAAGWVHWTDARGRDRRSVVVTTTLDLVDGGVATVVPMAMDVLVEDRTPWKATADVLVRGEASAHAGERALVRVAIARGPDILFTKEAILPHGDAIPWGGRAGPWAAPLAVDDATPPHQFQLAPEDQRVDELWGGEQILVSETSPERETMHYRLPAITPFVQSGDVTLPVSLDTMRLDLRDGRCTLTWRSVVPPEHHPTALRIVWLPILEIEAVEGTPRAWLLGRPPLLPVEERERVPILNASRFEPLSFTWCRSAGAWAHTVVVKGTFDIGAGEVALADEQVPIGGDEVAVGDPATGAYGLRRATDCVPFKPEPEVLVVATAHAPPQQEVALVRLTLGDVNKRVVALGPRRWAADGTPGKAGPFTPVPIHHGMAFGGPGHEPNPVGMGESTDALPCLENPDALIRRRGAAVAPACFAPIPVSWKARSEYAKDIDAKVSREQAPALPKGLDLRIFQSAPPDQRSRARASAGAWIGDEAFELTAVLPGGGKLAGRLPGVAPQLYARRPDGSITAVVARLDTVTIDADARQLQLVWRGVLAIADEDASDVAEILVCDGAVGATHDVDVAWAMMRSRRDPRFVRPSSLGSATRVAVPWVTAPSLAARPSDADLPPTPHLEPPTRGEVEAWIASDALAERDLSRADLHDLDFTRKNLTGARLDGATLDGARFDEAVLCDASLADAHGTSTSWRGADLSRADATRIALTDADFTMAILSDATFEASTLTDMHFDEAQASSLQLGSAAITDASFEGATLTGSIWSRSTCERLVLRGADLTGSKWLGSRVRDVDGQGAVFAKAQLDDAVWEGAKLAELRATASSWEGATLIAAVLVGAELVRASLSRVDLTGADLTGANLVQARLDKAKLRSARLRAANLMQTALERADFTDADATGANLYQANLRGAQLQGTRLEDAHLAGTLLDPTPPR